MAFFKRLSGGYEDLWKSIIRPPREEYEENQLGPVDFVLQGHNYHRSDLDLTNDRGLHLKCSHFEPVEPERPAQSLPCVVYLHANCSSRLEALSAVQVLMPSGITVFSFDFSGCGKSEGEYISLGWYERDDLACVIEHLRRSGRVSYIGLWGRSMGAVTALLHADRDHSIAGMVLDSPFSSLYVLAGELAETHAKVPKFVLSTALSFLRKTVKKKAKFDIKDLKPIDHVEGSFMPALFGVGTEDTFINPTHSQALFDRYAGDKNIVHFDGDHNSQRPEFFYDSVGIFFYNALMCESIPQTAPSEDVDEEELVRRAIELSLKENQEAQG